MDLSKLKIRDARVEDSRWLEQFCRVELDDKIGEVRPDDSSDLAATKIRFLVKNGMIVAIEDVDENIVGVMVMQPDNGNNDDQNTISRLRFSEELINALLGSDNAEHLHRLFRFIFQNKLGTSQFFQTTLRSRDSRLAQILHCILTEGCFAAMTSWGPHNWYFVYTEIMLCNTADRS
jgi:hypothetical protein